MTNPPKNVQRSSPQPAKPRERPPLSREEVARWLVGNTGCLLRRIRGRTRAAGPGAAGPFAASLMDEQDILASVMRRVDAAAAGGSLRARSDAELWGFARTVVANVVQSRLRQGRRDIELFAVASPAEQADIVAVAEAEFERLAPLLTDKMRREDWDSVTLRARGEGGRTIAAAAGVSEPAERKRWSRLLRLVRAAVSMKLRPAPPPPPARLGCSALRSSSGIGCMTCAA